PSAFAVGSASVTCGRSAARAKRGSPPITTAAAVVPAATFRKRRRDSLFSSCDIGNLRRWGESPSRAANGSHLAETTCRRATSPAWYDPALVWTSICMSQQLPDSIPPDLFAARADAIAGAARELALAGWTPATSSNFSMRIDDGHAAITISGRDKGRLTRDDIMLVDMQGRAVGTDARPSAETALHTQVYRHWPEAQAVLH